MRERLKLPTGNLVRGGILAVGIAAYPFLTGFSSVERSTVKGVGTAVSQEIPLQAPKLANHLATQTLDSDYARFLIKYLQTDRGVSSELKRQAVEENLISIHDYERSGCSGLQIDESGYFLTAAHCLAKYEIFTEMLADMELDEEWETWLEQFRDPRLAALSPGRRLLSPINSAVYDLTGDLAIFYAPTQRPPKPIDNLQIRTDSIKLGESLTLLTDLGNVEEGTERRAVLTGRVIDQVHQNDTYFRRRIRVRGMMPFGGASGGPVIDSEGNLVAIESGFYTENPDLPLEVISMAGATVVPIQGIESLLSLPISYLSVKIDVEP